MHAAAPLQPSASARNTGASSPSGVHSVALDVSYSLHPVPLPAFSHSACVAPGPQHLMHHSHGDRPATTSTVMSTFAVPRSPFPRCIASAHPCSAQHTCTSQHVPLAVILRAPKQHTIVPLAGLEHCAPVRRQDLGPFQAQHTVARQGLSHNARCSVHVSAGARASTRQPCPIVPQLAMSRP